MLGMRTMPKPFYVFVSVAGMLFATAARGLRVDPRIRGHANSSYGIGAVLRRARLEQHSRAANETMMDVSDVLLLRPAHSNTSCRPATTATVWATLLATAIPRTSPSGNASMIVPIAIAWPLPDLSRSFSWGAHSPHRFRFLAPAAASHALTSENRRAPTRREIAVRAVPACC